VRNLKALKSYTVHVSLLYHLVTLNDFAMVDFLIFIFKGDFLISHSFFFLWVGGVNKEPVLQ